MRKLKLFSLLLMLLVGMGQVWGADQTLTESEIKSNFTSSAHSYGGDPASYVDGEVTWYLGDYSTTASSKWFQIKKDQGVYLKITTPEDTKITSLSLTITSATNSKGGAQDITKHSAYSGRIALSTEDITGSTSMTGVGYTESITNNSATITVSGTNRILYLKTSGAARIWGATISYETTGGTEKPTLSMSPAASGSFVGSQEITLSTETDGATVHYTTDGSTPTASSPSSPLTFTITETTTVSAIAIKGSESSDVISRTFTELTPKTTMDEIFAAATEAANTATDVAITFNNWVVTAVKGNNAYVSDGTKGFVIYGNGHGFVAGNILSGTALCQVKLYNGYAQLSSLTTATTGLSVGTGGTVTPIDIDDVADLNDYNGAYTGSVIRLIGECTTENSKFYILGVQLWNNLFTFTNPTAGKNYYCTGIYYYGGTTYGHEIMPRIATDIKEIPEQGAPEAPVFTPASDTYDEATNVTITCETDEAVIYYTMTDDGSTPATPDPTNDNQVYNGAINLDANGTYKFKAIAFKNDLTSTEVSATYVIDLPLPSYDFTYNFDFTAIDGFNSWNQSYTEHIVGYDILPAEPDGVADVNVVFASANKQGDNQPIIDRPVTKGGDVELKLLPATKKYITAVKFVCQQWNEKVQTITLHYSTDGGSTYSVLDPSVTSTNFTIQSLDLPETTNAVKITFNSTSNQVGISSVHFNLEDKPVVKKVVNITTPDAVEGTLVVKNGEDPISDGDEIEVGTILKIVATPQDGYQLTAVSVKDEDNVDVSINESNEFEVPNKNVTVSATFTEILNPAVLTLDVQGTTNPFPGSHNIGDYVDLPTTATACEGNVFVGWSEVEITNPGAKPATKYYDKGASYELKAKTQTLYAVYAQGSNATWQITSGDLTILDTETTSAYAKYAGDQTKGTITYNIADVMPATGGNEGKLQIKKSSGKLYNKTQFAADIESIVIEGYNIAVFEGEDVISSTPTSEAISGTGTDAYTYTFSSGKRYFHIQNNTNNAAYPASITVNLQAEYTNYTTSCIVPVNVPEPVFDVPAATYTAEQLVLIDNYDGQYIYVYTTDGSEPTADGNLEPVGTAQIYDENDGIEINASCTLKARAYDAEGNYSDVTSAVYIINLPLSSMQAIFDAATSTATSKSIAFSDAWVVSGVSADGHTAYLTDGTKGLILYNYSDDMDLAVGNTLSGTKECTLVLYKGAAELKDFTKESLTVGTGGTVSPASIAPANLTGVNTGALISLTNWKYDGTNLTKETTSIQPYTTLFDCEDAFEENRYYNVSGIYQQFNSTKEILPRSTDDIEELTQNAPTMAWYVSSTKEVTIAANATYSIDLGEAFAPIFETNSNGTLTYTSSDETIAEINETTGALTLKNVAGNTIIKCAVAADVDQNLAADELSFTLRVREESNSDNVVILAKQEGKWYAMKNTVTSSKAEGIEVVYVGGKIYNLSPDDQADITWKRTIDSEDNVTFQNPDNDLFLKTSSNDIKMEANETGNYQWTWNETYYRTGAQTRTFLYRAGTVNSFKSYAVVNAGDGVKGEYSALPVVTAAVFADGEPEPEWVELRAGATSGKYYTVCLKKKVVDFRGGNFWKMNQRSNNQAYLVEATVDELLAGTPFLFDVTGEKLEVVYEGADATAAVANGALRGLLNETKNQAGIDELATATGSDIYMLKNNELRKANGQTGNKLGEYKAYIVYNDLENVDAVSAPGRRVRTMPLQEQVATGCENIQAGEAPVKMMIDGQLFILRGEKMYDTTGRLVK